MKSIAIFNNKGGVGKTTYLFHIANLLADKGNKVLMVDCDSQCNLTAYSLQDNVIQQAWSLDKGNSIFRVIEKVYGGVGDISKRKPTFINENLMIVPGDVDLSKFEDRLGETWASASMQESSLRIQVAIFRYVYFIAQKNSVDYIFYDLGPNLGALNRAVLGGCDYFITPLSPDLFSIKGTANLGNKFVEWSEQWDDIINRWRKKSPVDVLPNVKPKFIGYVLQQYNVRSNSEGMAKGWQIFGDKVDKTVKDNIVSKLVPTKQVVERADYKLGAIPNLHSLIPYSLEARKPVYKCTSADGLNGTHISRARESSHYYDSIIEILESLEECYITDVNK